MRKKGIILSLIGIFLVSSLLITLVSKNNKRYIMQEGIILALTLDGEEITEFPSDKNYRVDVKCMNGDAIWLPDEWKLSISNITGNLICNIDFYKKTDDDKLINIVEEKGTQYNGANSESAGYRYSGQFPNNYIWFNNEMWRIIGSVPTKKSDGSISNLVKIIRNDSIGVYSYDAKSENSTNEWGGNTLYTHLNTHFYATSTSNLNGQNSDGCYSYVVSARPNCDYTNNGILATSFYGQMVEQVYWNTGGSNDGETASTSYSKEIANQTVKGYVGLMNPSDYGFATINSYHDYTLYEYNGKRASNNWLFSQSYEWTSNFDYKYNDGTEVLAIYDSGNIGNTAGKESYNNIKNGMSVRPVVYLDSNVFVVMGDGSITNPYQIAL